MANKVKTLVSGAELSMTTSNFQLSHSLFKVVMKELGGVSQDQELNKKMMIKLVSSDEIEKALWPCMERCTYNGMKVLPKLFDEVEEAREDFLTIATEVLDFNLSPFFRSVSLSSTA